MVPVWLFVILLLSASQGPQLISIQLEVCISASLEIAHAYAVDVVWRSMALSALDNGLAEKRRIPIPPDHGFSVSHKRLLSGKTETDTTRTCRVLHVVAGLLPRNLAQPFAAWSRLDYKIGCDMHAPHSLAQLCCHVGGARRGHFPRYGTTKVVSLVLRFPALSQISL